MMFCKPSNALPHTKTNLKLRGIKSNHLLQLMNSLGEGFREDRAGIFFLCSMKSRTSARNSKWLGITEYLGSGNTWKPFILTELTQLWLYVRIPACDFSRAEPPHDMVGPSVVEANDWSNDWCPYKEINLDWDTQPQREYAMGKMEAKTGVMYLSVKEYRGFPAATRNWEELREGPSPRTFREHVRLTP